MWTILHFSSLCKKSLYFCSKSPIDIPAAKAVANNAPIDAPAI